MQLEAKKILYDIIQAAERISVFTAHKRFDDYRGDVMLQAAVERQFEIIGEALSQLTRLDENPAARITEHHRIIAFRNILIHGYAVVDARMVWDVVEAKLPILRAEVQALLGEP
jgi:uncharacterized protein with HEPN domain